MEPDARSSSKGAATSDDVRVEIEKKRVKPALKKPALSPKKPKKELKWDEEVIEEHDHLRGTRMKIDEPNTPFTAYDSHSDHESEDGTRRAKSPIEEKNELNWDQLHSKLTTAAEHCPSSPESGGLSDDDRHRQFKEHRKQHYNEMERVRQFRAQHASLSDEDDDDANDADDDMDIK